MLLLNRRAIRLGSWNHAITLAAVSVAERRGGRATIAWLAKQTKLSGAAVHRMVHDLSRADMIAMERVGRRFFRRLTSRGRRKIRTLCED